MLRITIVNLFYFIKPRVYFLNTSISAFCKFCEQGSLNTVVNKILDNGLVELI